MKPLLRPLRLLAIVVATVSPLTAAERRLVTEIPPGFTPCKIVKQERVIFPPRMLQEGVTRGEAHVVVEIGVDGRVTDSLITLYTQRAFAEESLRAARASRYAPSTTDGQPLITIMQLQFVFDSRDPVVTSVIGFPTLGSTTPATRYEYYPFPLSALDRPPATRQTTPPIYPQAWIDQGRKGTIKVSFYLDETGRARMPIARDASDDLLANSACAAVKEWRFDPPVRHGQPVLAQVELPIIFDPPPKAAPQPGT
jgi:TonB family protein